MVFFLEKQWGKYNIPIYTDKDCTNTTESSTKRQGFYIHGGESYGDNGGIDLAKEDTRFFQVLESLKQEYKDILEYIKDDKGGIIIKLEVGYEEEISEKLSKYFTISDVTKTNQKTAYFSNAQLIELNKKEAMILENYKKLKLLALNCDKIVDWIGYKPNVNSGVRVDAVNENLPNSSKKGKSQHTKCEAFDLGFNSKNDLKKSIFGY